MRDAKLTFSYATVASGAANALKVTPVSGSPMVVLNSNGSSGVPVATSNELNYGGLLVNGVSGAVMDSNYSGGAVADAGDYVRGQILNPLFVTSPIATSWFPASTFVTMAVHGSDVSGFTAGATNILAQSIWSAPVAYTGSVTYVTGAGGAVTAGVTYYIISVNTSTGALGLSLTRGGVALPNLTSATLVNVADAFKLSVNQQIMVTTSVGASTTSTVTSNVYNENNSAIISVPLQSYAKFLVVRWTLSAPASSGSDATSGNIVVARTAFQTGREGSI